jgi:hypothetical protein
MKARVKPPASIEKPNPKYITKKEYPKSPKTIEGVAAKVSKAVEIMLCTKGFFSEKTARNTAVAIESGTDTPRQMARIRKDELITSRIPPALPASLETVVKNSKLKAPDW